jgi:ABC-type sugar transport system ATPase subunit
MARVVLSNVSKAFQGPKHSIIRAVTKVDLTVANGELVTLVGPSGCGKTTLLRLIAGLETPDTGTITLDDEVVNDLEPQARNVAMGFQRDALFPHLTAFENLALGMKLRGVPAAEARKRVNEIAATLGITDCLPRLPGELSGGQRQRVALGRALVRQPQVLLLDEPFANLDGPLRRELRRELLRLHRKQQPTVILVTHDQAEALALGQRVAVMRAGALEQIATPMELRSKPATQFVAEFLNPAVI